MNKLDSNAISFEPEILTLSLPNELFQKIVGYLDPQNMQNVLQVNSYFSANVIENTRVKENTLIEDFAKFLSKKLKKLNQNLYQDQINELLCFCNTAKTLSLLSLLEIKTSLLETKEAMLDILKSLNLEDLNKLKKLHLSRSKPSFFEDIFDIAIADVSKIYEELESALKITQQNKREYALTKIFDSFIKINNINKAIEIANTIIDDKKKKKCFIKICQTLLEKRDLEKTIIIFNAIENNDDLKSSIFVLICEYLSENGCLDQLLNLINKTEELTVEVEEEINLNIKALTILEVFQKLLISLPANSNKKEIIKLAYSLEDINLKTVALSLICQAFVKERRSDEAFAIANAAASKLNPRANYEILKAIVNPWVGKENIDMAIRFINPRITDQEDKATTLMLASSWLAEVGNRARALEIARTINVEEITEELGQQILELINFLESPLSA